MKFGRQLPSMAFTLAVIGVVLFVPFLAVSSAQWRSSSDQVANAQRVQQSTARLDVLLRLGPAVNNELLSTGWTAGREDLISELPDTAVPLLSLNVASSVEESQARVDVLAQALNDPELDELIATARLADARDITALAELGYSPLNTWVAESLETERVILTSVASATGDASITRSVRVAVAAADVQTAIVGMEGRWAQLASGDLIPPRSEDIRLFHFGLVEFQNRSASLDRSLPPSGPIRQQWDAFANGNQLQTVLAQYAATADKIATDGISTQIAEPGAPSQLDLSNIDLFEALSLAAQVSEVLDSAEQANVQLDAVVDAAISELRANAEASVNQARAERQSTIFWLALSVSLFTGAVLAVALLVGQPVRRMAEAAGQLGEGNLDVQVPERGPRELRIGSAALNQALASLKTTEAQAVALAEERLDDPILEQTTPGNLGASLQAAVERLTASLADRERIQHQLEYEATHDSLTKLANRRAVITHLKAAIARADRAETDAALLFIDMDNFKAVNDSHGHYSGDNVLRTIASRLMETIRDGDLAGRLGGDEFVVVAEPIDGIDAAVDLAQRIRKAINQPIVFDGTTIVPDVSIGIGLSSGDLTADEILRDADLAVYRAKSSAKSHVHVCDEALRSAVDERAELEEAIVHAIEHDEFVMHYQPTVRARDRRITSVEALIRWNHQTRGSVSPVEFIPVAERTDLIVELDCWVLDATAQQLEAWAQGNGTSELQVAVNISGRHLSSGRLAAHVHEIVNSYDFDPSCLILEVTETALLDDLDTAAQELAELRALGVRIALDDFGTGFMSLTHLRSLPVDVVKIDRSFVADSDDLETRSLIQLLLDTCHLLDIAVTAEGIETEQESNIMTDLGSDSLQGFLFSRPKPAAEVTAEIHTALSKQAA